MGLLFTLLISIQAAGSSWDTSDPNKIWGKNSSGNSANVIVGVGNSSPTFTLDVQRTTASTNPNADIRIDAPVNNTTSLKFTKAASSTPKWNYYVPANSNDFRIAEGTTDRITYQAGGTVGIGTTSPTSTTRLHVKGAGSDFNTYSLMATNSNNSPVLCVRNDGKIGIGTLSPLGDLHVVDNSVSCASVATFETNFTNRMGLTVSSTGEMSTGGYIVGNIFGVQVLAHSASNFLVTGGSFDAHGNLQPQSIALGGQFTGYGSETNKGGHFDGNGGSNAYGAEFSGHDGSNYNYGGSFSANGGTPSGYTMNYGVYASATVPSGGMGANYGGYFTASGAPHNNIGIYAEGSYYAGQFLGDVIANNYYNWSDGSLKKDVRQLDSALAKVMLLNPVTYSLDAEKYPNMNLSDRPQIGLIAQDVETVFPQIVKENLIPKNRGKMTKSNSSIGEEVDTLKAVDYMQLIPVLTKALQELKVANDNQQKRIQKLEQALGLR
jgi:hypothetical protein